MARLEYWTDDDLRRQSKETFNPEKKKKYETELAWREHGQEPPPRYSKQPFRGK